MSLKRLAQDVSRDVGPAFPLAKVHPSPRTSWLRSWFAYYDVELIVTAGVTLLMAGFITAVLSEWP